MADCCTCTGADLFYPYPGPCVIPANPRYRLETGSAVEHGLLGVLVLLLGLAWPLSVVGGTWRALRYLLATPTTAYTDYRDTTTQALLDFRGRWQDTHAPVTGQALG